MPPNDKYITEALAAFRRATGFKAEYRRRSGNRNLSVDGSLRVDCQGSTWDFVVQARLRVTTETPAVMRHSTPEGQRDVLVVTPYVSPPMADRFRALDIFFIDAAGNAYINRPPMYVFIKGNRPLIDVRPAAPSRLFRAGGLRIVFALLVDPSLVDRPYRDMAVAAGVALGTVGGCIQELKAAGYLLNLGPRQHRLANTETLLKRWVEAYPEQLRPKLVRDRFAADRPDWWKRFDIASIGGAWGGEIAAARLIGSLKPAKVTVYTEAPFGVMVFQNRLRKEPDGDVEILTPFWHCDHELSQKGLVPPLLVYADLLASGDPRNIETAEEIHERYLSGLVR